MITPKVLDYKKDPDEIKVVSPNISLEGLEKLSKSSNYNVSKIAYERIEARGKED